MYGMIQIAYWFCVWNWNVPSFIVNQITQHPQNTWHIRNRGKMNRRRGKERDTHTQTQSVILIELLNCGRYSKLLMQYDTDIWNWCHVKFCRQLTFVAPKKSLPTYVEDIHANQIYSNRTTIKHKSVQSKRNYNIKKLHKNPNCASLDWFVLVNLFVYISLGKAMFLFFCFPYATILEDGPFICILYVFMCVCVYCINFHILILWFY